jgi:hypothetical protein
MSLIFALLATAVSLPAHPEHVRSREDGPGAAIRRAMAERGPIVTDGDRAAIRAKCGMPADAELKSINFTDGGLRCPDGRMVRDEETTAMGKRIGERARATARAAMDDPQVKAALARHIDAKTHAALARIRARRAD